MTDLRSPRLQMYGMQFFPFLKSLSIISQKVGARAWQHDKSRRLTHAVDVCSQDIKVIESLDECVYLEKLYLVENSITKIRGLENLTNLKELFLFSNRISKIENLERLTNIEILSLADNYISSVEGLGTLVKLRELNLARNDLSVIGDALSANTALQILNLSDSGIGSFKVGVVRFISAADVFVGL